MGRKLKPSDELPTHFLHLVGKDGKPDSIWRVRLLNPHGYTNKDGIHCFIVIPDPNKHRGLDCISDVAEERLRPIVPSPRITRMLAERYELHVRKERGKESYMLYYRLAASDDSPFKWSVEDMLVLDPATLRDEKKLCEAIENALRHETPTPL